MTVAESTAVLPPARGGDYEIARFNALRRGVLSKYCVLPWEDGAEYEALLPDRVRVLSPGCLTASKPPACRTACSCGPVPPRRWPNWPPPGR